MSRLFRIENQETFQGLWYNKDGVKTDFLRTNLTDAKCRDMPMGYDPLYGDGGLRWISATDNAPDMRHWLSLQDATEMLQQGYHVYEFEVSQYRREFGHAIFTREHVIRQRIVDLDVLDLV
jgi:hypothetical protein